MIDGKLEKGWGGGGVSEKNGMVDVDGMLLSKRGLGRVRQFLLN
jgi:hypothetical protein